MMATPGLRMRFRYGMASGDLVSFVRRCADQLNTGKHPPLEVLVDFERPSDPGACHVCLATASQRVTDHHPDPYVALQGAFDHLAATLASALPVRAE